MNPKSGISPFTFVGFGLALAVLSWMALSRQANEYEQALLASQMRSTTVDAIALKALVDDLVETSGYEEKRAFRDLANAWKHQNSAIRELRIIKIAGARLLALSPLPTDGAVLPRRLKRDEKFLFDQAKRLKTAALTNREEGSARKPEIEFAFTDEGRLEIAVPFEEHGKVAGMIQIKQSSDATPAEVGTLFVLVVISIWLGFFAISAALFAKQPFFLKNERGFSPGQTLLACGLVVLYCLWLLHFLQAGGTAELAQNLHRIEIAHEKAFRSSNLVYEQLRGSLKGQSVTTAVWDVDPFRRSYGLLNPSGEVSAEVLTEHLAEHTRQRKDALWLFTAGAELILLFFCLGGARHVSLALKENKSAYFYILPAMLGMAILVFFPFLFGIALSFTDSNIYNANLSISEIWVGLANYAQILLDFNIFSQGQDGSSLVNYENFYWTLLVTVLWTVCNVAIGVSVGLVLALALNAKNLRFRLLYRTLLILPWAIPNYITALVWKGMFHKQFGAFNQLIQAFGFEPVAWFDGVFSSFFTGIATNGWLSFPFMMVICLGGLQSISSDMYEAARLDGASRWQQFVYITLPSLKIVLIPAIIISVVWTFNMFNIIFLVSAGEPGGANEILITKAYKIAFEQYRYGYAAAYSTVIFAILLIYGVFQARFSNAMESNT